MGPTLPPISSFTLPTGPTGSIGPTGSTGIGNIGPTGPTGLTGIGYRCNRYDWFRSNTSIRNVEY
ncbi:exosporium leader peptide-containing protein [Bacillus cereus]|uniref:exosporium leader peptide-containing protein n=1 Tax=Bacillus cereus TaxID=1396 RepID=UPI003C2C5DE5